MDALHWMLVRGATLALAGALTSALAFVIMLGISHEVALALLCAGIEFSFDCAFAVWHSSLTAPLRKLYENTMW